MFPKFSNSFLNKNVFIIFLNKKVKYLSKHDLITTIKIILFKIKMQIIKFKFLF